MDCREWGDSLYNLHAMEKIIYLDNNATTMPLPEVVEAMLPVLREGYANPSSVHQFGQLARHRVECARLQVASLIGVSAKEIVFTSGGTESINLAIRSALSLNLDRRHVVTTAVEHSAGLRVVEDLAAKGYEVEYIGVDGEGQLDETQLAKAIRDDTALVSLIHANNETGVVFDVAKLAALAAEKKVPVHVDAVQSTGKLAMDVSTWPVQFMSLSAHKFHGPKGVGALFVRRRTRIEPQMLGGGQEMQRRGGTENVAGIVGMGVAAELALNHLETCAKKVGAMRDRLESGLMAAMPTAQVIASHASRLYNTTNIAFEGLGAEAILILLSEAGICASSGSACSSGSLEPSHVLKAMGIEERVAHGAIRFSLSSFNTDDEIDWVIEEIPRLLSRLMALNRS